MFSPKCFGDVILMCAFRLNDLMTFFEVGSLRVVVFLEAWPNSCLAKPWRNRGDF